MDSRHFHVVVWDAEKGVWDTLRRCPTLDDAIAYYIKLLRADHAAEDVMIRYKGHGLSVHRI